MHASKLLLLSGLVSTLMGCGGSSSSSDVSSAAPAKCPPVANQVNLCLLEDLKNITSPNDAPEKLSSYNFFKDNQDPTRNPNSKGFPYDLTSPLFTDYSTKYRFIFMPDGKKAQYSAQEVFDFPVGSVLVKTFALPKDTANRGYNKGSDNEKLIETRLLIHTEGRGWLALGYLWNEQQTDAIFTPQGKNFRASLIHKGQQKDFTYGMPDIATCKSCHQLTNIINDKSVSEFAPIGPKARLLNRDHEINGIDQNQIRYMVDNNFLEGAPANISDIATIPTFDDNTDITGKSPAELQSLAKGYLDINCAHCHRRTGGGSAFSMDGKGGYSGLKVEFWRSFEQNKLAHGVCKTPIAYTADTFAFDLLPGNAEKSILVHRMELQTAKRMPEVGRDLIHTEGVNLMKAWINSLPADNCGQ